MVVMSNGPVEGDFESVFNVFQGAYGARLSARNIRTLALHAYRAEGVRNGSDAIGWYLGHRETNPQKLLREAEEGLAVHGSPTTLRSVLLGVLFQKIAGYREKVGDGTAPTATTLKRTEL